MTSDHALLIQLGSIFQSVDPVPPDVIDMARACLSWRDPDVALARLVSDSLVHSAQVRTRRAAGPRLLTFEADGLVIEVEVAADGNTRRLLGQLVPPTRASVVVRWANSQVETKADDIGRFSASGIPAGPVSLSCTRAGTTQPVTTSWVRI
jgi:hypothetical protein